MVKIAVAANFTEPVKEIAALFETSTGHKLVLSFGATGQFYRADHARRAVRGLPLAPTQRRRPRRSPTGHAVPGTAFTYAIGKLVLCSKTRRPRRRAKRR